MKIYFILINIPSFWLNFIQVFLSISYYTKEKEHLYLNSFIKYTKDSPPPQRQSELYYY
jgi:hypothetical protein